MQRGTKIAEGSIVDLSENLEWIERYRGISSTQFMVIGYMGTVTDPHVVLLEVLQGLVPFAGRFIRCQIKSEVWENASLVKTPKHLVASHS